MTTCISLDVFNSESGFGGSSSIVHSAMTGFLFDRRPVIFPTTHRPTLIPGLEQDWFNRVPSLSLNNTEPPPQLSHETNTEDTVGGQPIGLYSCKGTWIKWLPGSIWDTYAYAQHELSHVTWQLSQIDEDNNRIETDGTTPKMVY
jgi:hypothetical protein